MRILGLPLPAIGGLPANSGGKAPGGIAFAGNAPGGTASAGNAPGGSAPGKTVPDGTASLGKASADNLSPARPLVCLDGSPAGSPGGGTLGLDINDLSHPEGCAVL